MSDKAADHAMRMEKLDQLVAALWDHPSMAPVKASIPSTPNRPDGRSVPAVQNSIYFLWDFVNRTRFMLSQIEPSRDAKKASPKVSQKKLNEQFNDVIGRSALAHMLITDPAKLAMMGGGAPGPPPEFGSDIKRLSDELSTPPAA